MTRFARNAVVVLSLAASPPAWPQVATAGPAVVQATGIQSRSGKLKHFADADGVKLVGELTAAAVAFPLRIYEETDKGMVRVQVGGKDHWVAAEDLKILRPTNAACMTAPQKVATAADRGANEGCSVKR